MSDNLKPKPLFVRLTLPANAVDVTADAAITAVIGAGRCSRPARPAANAGVDSDVPRSGAGARRASGCPNRGRKSSDQCGASSPPALSAPAGCGRAAGRASARSACPTPRPGPRHHGASSACRRGGNVAARAGFQPRLRPPVLLLATILGVSIGF
jgi:hypothetical protein